MILCKKPGVYFLFGIQEDGKPLVYVGESEVIYKRLVEHLNTKDYWNECVVFISKDEYLNKAHIKYLEHRFYSLAKEANRYVIKNDTIPTKSNLSEAEEAELEEFIYNAKILIGTLGHKTFEPIKKTIDQEQDTLFYFERRGGKRGKGKGIPTSEGFIVSKEIKNFYHSLI